MTRLPILSFALLLAVCCATPVAALERYHVVRIQDNAGETSYEVMTPEQYRDLQGDLRVESQLHSKALSAARDAWGDSEELSSEAFISSSARPRKASTVGPSFRDRAEAEAKMADYLDRDARSVERREEHEKERQKQRGRSRDPNAKERAAREAAREAEREQLKVRARDLYKAKLDELLQERKADEAAREAAREERGY